jgi:hypothetical protein
MECPLETGRAAELIVGFHARTLDPHAAAAFERHLKVCPGCNQVSAAQQAVWSALDVWQPQPISPDFDQKLIARIAKEEGLRWWQRIRPPAFSWRPALSVALACAALLGALLLQPPVGIPVPFSPQPKVQIEQVEHALDDMDMLKQIGVEAAPTASSSRERI